MTLLEFKKIKKLSKKRYSHALLFSSIILFTYMFFSHYTNIENYECKTEESKLDPITKKRKMCFQQSMIKIKYNVNKIFKKINVSGGKFQETVEKINKQNRLNTRNLKTMQKAGDSLSKMDEGGDKPKNDAMCDENPEFC